ncbi:MAG: hypothetical protein MAG794_00385 [Gammaproteobacteria bacterium]|nr:hypothetical protein [Gammaproteobacteria bacterium]
MLWGPFEMNFKYAHGAFGLRELPDIALRLFPCFLLAPAFSEVFLA